MSEGDTRPQAPTSAGNKEPQGPAIKAAQFIRDGTKRQEVAFGLLLMGLVGTVAIVLLFLIPLARENHRLLECAMGRDSECQKRQEQAIEKVVQRVVDRVVVVVDERLLEHDKAMQRQHDRQEFIIREEGDTIIVTPRDSRSPSSPSPSPSPSPTDRPTPRPSCQIHAPPVCIEEVSREK